MYYYLIVATAVVGAVTAWLGWITGSVETAVLSAAMLLSAVAAHAIRAGSAFLRATVTIFTVQVLAGSVFHIGKELGLWSDLVQDLPLTANVVTSLAMFPLIAAMLWQLEIVRRALLITDRFFTSPLKVRIPWLPASVAPVRESTLAMAAIWAGILINEVATIVALRMNFVQGQYMDALQQFDAGKFWKALLLDAPPLMLALVVTIVLTSLINGSLVTRWRQYLADDFARRWMASNANYEIALSDASIDNPDQRIQDDVPVVIGMKDGAGIGVFSFLSSITVQVMSLLGYISILWGVSANIKVFGVAVPGLLVWVALLWSAVATYLTFRIGRRMVPLSVEQQHLEADYRFSLARPREYAEEIAMMRGGQREYQGISQRFSLVTGNAYTLVGMNTLLNTLNTVLAAVRDNLHYVLLVPLVISRDLTLGQMTMAGGAFSFVNAVFGFFISYFTSIAQFRAALNRLSSFDAALDKASANTVKGQVTQGHSDAFVLKEVSIMRPDESVMVPPISLVLRGGCNVFVSGPSGSGKSTLFRVLAGIWPFWHGQLELPAARRVLILPQASYIPIGSLLNAITYPDPAGSHPREAVAQVLDMVGLGKLVERLDAVEPWPMQLSGGEQQRLAFARALLIRPEWLLLDEATSALDSPSELKMYELLAAHLPNTTVVSIAHREQLAKFHQRHIKLSPHMEALDVA